jgi:LPS-assembly protein
MRKATSAQLASIGIAAIAFGLSSVAQGQPAVPKARPDQAANRSDKNIVLTADKVTRDDVNNTVSATGHVELVQGPTMILAERVIWNRNTDIVIATGNVKMVSDDGDIYFGDYLELTDDMRQGFMDNVSGLLSDNSRLVGRKANKDGDIITIYRGVFSPCELCAEDPSQPPTWEIKAQEVIHDSVEKRLYFHDATFDLDGLPIAWTPYFSTYDPTVKRATGFLETLPGYRSQLGTFIRSRYYFDIAPDIDFILEGAYYSEQGPLIGGDYRERFDTGQIELSGSIAESDIRQYSTSLNQDEKTVRGHYFGSGEFDLDDNWRLGFQFARSLDNIYVLKYEYSSLQVLPSDLYVEGFFDRDYIKASFYSFQDLRAGITQVQPKALPYVTYSFFGDPGDTLGGRWADSGSILDIQRYGGGDNPPQLELLANNVLANRVFPGESVERLANNFSWTRKMVSDFGLVTNLDASLETDYYWTQNAIPDPVTQQLTAQRSIGRVFPQADAIISYPLTRPLGYAQLIVEPMLSAVVAPARTNNLGIPNEDSQDIQLDESNMFSGNRFPGTDRIEDGSRVTYGVKAGIYNLGTGYASAFIGQSYRITGSSLYLPVNSGLQSRFSDYVGQVEISPGKLIDISYRTEWSNDVQTERLQEVIFRVGPDNYGVFGSYLFSGKITGYLLSTDFSLPQLAVGERDELNLGGYYKFNDHWSVSAGSTTELTQPPIVLRYNVNATYSDDCSSFTVSAWHNQTFIIGGTSGTGVSLQFTLKDLGMFRLPAIH